MTFRVLTYSNVFVYLRVQRPFNTGSMDEVDDHDTLSICNVAKRQQLVMLLSLLKACLSPVIFKVVKL